MADLTSVGNLLIAKALPEDMRRAAYNLDKKSSDKLMAEVQAKYPERYKKIVHDLYTLGGYAAEAEGHTITLSETIAPPEIKAEIQKLKDQIELIVNNDKYDSKTKNDMIVKLVSDNDPKLRKMLEEITTARGNSLALQAKTGSRGNFNQLKQIITGDGLVVDHRDRVIGVPILTGYSSGLDPVQYFAASYGARKGSVCLEENTNVRMADGTTKKIKNIQIGDIVISANKHGELSQSRVTNKYCNGLKVCHRYTFNNRYGVTCTPEHKFLNCVGNVTPIDYVDRSVDGVDRISFAKGTQDNNDYVIDVKYAYIAGILISKNIQTENIYETGISFRIKNSQTYDKFTQQLNNLNISYSVDVATDFIKIDETNVELFDWLTQEDIVTGDLYTRALPKFIWHWNKQSLIQFLNGFFDTNINVSLSENIHEAFITIQSKNHKLIAQLHDLFNYRIGIITKRISRKKDRHTLRIRRPRSILLLASLLQLTNPYGKERLHQLVTICTEHIESSKIRDGWWIYDKSDPYDANTFDIEIEHEDHLFLLDGGFIVSNSTKFATQEAGFFGKQLAQAAHRVVVTQEDCGATTGIPTKADDPDNIGTVLAADAPGFKAGTIITPDIAKKLGDKPIMVRSPMTCQAPEGICAKCAGVREKGKLPDIGDNIGLPSAQAVSEKMSQGMLCLDEDTPVRMADWTVKPIKDINPGDMVIGVNFNRDIFPVKVLNKFDNGLRGCFKTDYAPNKRAVSLKSIVCTLEHKILSYVGPKDGYKLLPVADKTYVPLPQASKLVFGTVHDEMALMLGCLIGDGSITKAVKSPHLSCADPSMIDDLNKKYNHLGISLTKLKYHGGIYYGVKDEFSGKFERDIKGRVMKGTRNRVKAYLENCGLWGKYSYEKELPAVVWTYNKESLGDLLGGLFATDGSIYYGTNRSSPSVNYTTTSKKLVMQVEDLLAKFCVYGHIYAEGFSGERRDRYTLVITNASSVNKFFDNVNLIGIKKTRKAYALTTKGSTHYKVVDQQHVGLKCTYDIEVDHPDHMFLLANNLIVSNSMKHGGGSIGSSGPTKGGFDYVNHLIQAPMHFAGAAPLTSEDGRVQSIDKAPQGGNIVKVNDKEYYVPPEQQVTVKPGDTLEAGDALSNGTPNPSEVVKYKGIGAGRLYFVGALSDGFKNSGVSSNRRNIEVLSRGLVNHVKITDPDGHSGFLPEDIVPYDEFRKHYEPRRDAQELPVDRALNHYLEKDVGHHTIGTRITPRVQKDLKSNNYNSITVHKDPPPFEPVMVRAMENAMRDPNWMTRMYGSYLEKGFTDAVRRGREANLKDTSFVPGMASGTDFGKQLKTKGLY